MNCTHSPTDILIEEETANTFLHWHSKYCLVQCLVFLFLQYYRPCTGYSYVHILRSSAYFVEGVKQIIAVCVCA